jgi:hypothetical protein
MAANGLILDMVRAVQGVPGQGSGVVRLSVSSKRAVLAVRLFALTDNRTFQLEELTANLDRPHAPAVPRMHASLHHVTTTIIVVGIIACVVRIIIVVAIVAGPKESSGEEPSSVMEAMAKTVIETAALETIGCKAAALHTRNSCGTDRSRAREAAVKATGMECASSKPSRAESTAAESPTPAAAESPTPAAAEATSKSAAVTTATAAAAVTTAAATARQGYVWRQHAE